MWTCDFFSQWNISRICWLHFQEPCCGHKNGRQMRKITTLSKNCHNSPRMHMYLLYGRNNRHTSVSHFLLDLLLYTTEPNYIIIGELNSRIGSTEQWIGKQIEMMSIFQDSSKRDNEMKNMKAKGRMMEGRMRRLCVCVLIVREEHRERVWGGSGVWWMCREGKKCLEELWLRVF